MIKDTSDAEELTTMNIIANKYNLKIDWVESDISKKELYFIGEASDDDILNFIGEMTAMCDEIIEE